MSRCIGLRLDNPRVTSYETALAALEMCAKAAKCGDAVQPGGPWVPLGYARSKVTKVQMDRNESIRFRLYDTDVVTWHKDGSVEVTGYPTVATTTFADRLLPLGLRLGQRLMTLVPHGDMSWQERWAGARVCHPDAVYRKGAEFWEPADPKPLSVLTVDRAHARLLSRRYHLADFRNWLSVAPWHMEVRHEHADLEEVLHALERRDFLQATKFLPLFQLPRGFGIADRVKPLPIDNVPWDMPITLGVVEKMREYIYWENGAMHRNLVPTMSLAAHEKQRRLVRQLEAMDIYV